MKVNEKMKRKLILSLVIAIFLFSIVAVQPVVADSHQHFVFNVGAFGYQAYYGARAEGYGEYGSFTAHYDDITFFICDQENFDKYVNGQSAGLYCLFEDVVDGEYKFRYPYADTWYRVFCNKDSIYAKDVTFDVYHDTTAPVVTLNLDTGATYGGIKEIRVTASDAKFSVRKLSLQYYSGSLIWTTAKTVYNTGSLSYNWNTKDWSNSNVKWRVVAEDTVNNERIKEVLVTVYNYIAPTTGETTQPTTTRKTTDSSPSETNKFIQLAIIIVFFFIIGVVIVYAVKKKDGKEKDLEMISEQVISKDAKVFVICPYCGSKTEQGIMKCRNCGAEL